MRAWHFAAGPASTRTLGSTLRHTASLNILRFALAPFAAIRGLGKPCGAARWRLAPPCDFRLVPGASVAPFGSVELAAAAAHLLGWARGRAFYYCATWRVLLRYRAHVQPNPSLEARPNSKTPGPRGGRAHFPPHGPGVLLLVPTQLER